MITATLATLLGAVVFGTGGGGLLSLILTIAVLGLVVWLITTYIPMPPVFRTVIWIIAAIFLIIMLLNMLGALGGGGVIST